MLELSALPPVAITLALLAVCAWAVSFVKNNTGIVDSFWGLFFLSGAIACAAALQAGSARALLVLALVAVWALRLTLHITIRNWGEPEDRRYQAIRARNQPGYAWKSLYLVFGLQAVLALIIGMPLFVAVGSTTALNAMDYAGLAL